MSSTDGTDIAREVEDFLLSETIYNLYVEIVAMCDELVECDLGPRSARRALDEIANLQARL